MHKASLEHQVACNLPGSKQFGNFQDFLTLECFSDATLFSGFVVRGAKKDADTQMADVNSDEAGQVPASTAPGDVRAESGEAPDGLGEMNRDSDKEKQAGHSMREEGKEPAPENSQGEAQEESPGAEAKESENGNAPLKRAEGASAHSEAEAGESEKPDGLATEDVWVEEIPVNSIVLAAKSCVLQRMLSNGMKESDKSEPLLLKVTPQGGFAALPCL